MKQIQLIAVVLAGACACAAQAQTVLKIGYATTATSHYGVGTSAFCEELEKATQNRYKCQQFPAGALGGEREMVEAVQLGTLDLVNTSAGPVGNFVPEVKVVDIPFLFRDYEHARKVLDGPIGQDLLNKFPSKGLVALGWTEIGFRHMTNYKLPIVKPADAAGL
jgi:TRAP-type C4-dicarboxylate transport system substrate-binding protein